MHPAAWKTVSVLLAILSLQSARGQSGITRVWAVNDGEKIEQDALDHPLAEDYARNGVWDGQAIRIFGLRNEVVAFQLILEAEGQGASGVSVHLDSLVNGPAVLSNRGWSGALFDYRGRRIELFVEHYQEVSQRSVFVSANGSWLARPLPDDDHTGWIPDALVPAEAPVKRPVHGQGGSPFDIAGGRLQGVWVDVYVPRDALAGVYRGTVVVREQGAERYRIPVELQVYAVTLPEETHQRNFFHWNEELLPNRYGLSYGSEEYWSVFRRFMHEAHRHRMDLVDGRMSLDRFRERMAGYYTGASYTATEGYEGPGEGVGNRTYSIGTYDQPSNGWVSGFWPDTREGWQAAADAWEGWFAQNAPGVLRFKYMHDEADVTDPAVVSAMQEKCEWITTSPGVGSRLHRFFTKEFFYGGFYGYVDIWGFSGSPGLQLSTMRQRKDQYGELVCMYNGTRPMWGQMEVLDNFATDNRVNSWIAWKYGVDLLFLWQTSYYAEFKPPRTYNVWVDNYIAGSDGSKSWGSGMWLYPGRDIDYPGDDRGVDGPITSIRMKNFRRGQQDYEYLYLAQEAGLDVSGIVDRIVPRAIDDWGAEQYTNPPAYDQQPVYAQEGYRFEEARRELAQMLEQAGKTGSLPSGVLEIFPPQLPPGGGEVTLAWSTVGADSTWIAPQPGPVLSSGRFTLRVDSTTTFTLWAQRASEVFWVEATAAVQRTSPPDGSLPVEYRLYQNFPNPFNPQTLIRYALPADVRVVLTIHDVLGQELLRIIDDVVPAGVHEVVVNAAELSSGVYYYTLRADAYRETRKMVLLK